ncbi:polyphosphoinositide phosphatase [Magnaporthiopsis poae ATCC 64411]|uniref:Polyphosphoinositide phosphatase n=1 Tax=Magnaporthiopsis poae (strain ATCC 64411 / 73-15) TaxID=644358 RepID=A0A0C4DY53_MAGP6|nr:polyphosphoinositide phosphatase [Magnaporthiopsis poae ATCC 64411]
MAFPSSLEPGDAARQADVSIASGSTSAPDSLLTPPEPVEPIFPLLNNSTETDQTPLVVGALGQQGAGNDDNDDDDDERAVAKPFVRTSSPDGISKARHQASCSDDYDDDDQDRDQAANVGGPAEDGTGGGTGGAGGGGTGGGGGGGDNNTRRKRMLHKMHKYSLYETATRYYIVGGDVTERRYRILKIDRTAEEQDLSVTDDKIVYSQKEMNALLDTIDDGNKATGGIKLRCTTWGLLGFIKFTGHYYMLLITKKSTVAMLGGHYIYQIDGTELIPLTPARARPRPDQRNTEESRFLTILGNLDLTRSFYYSYSYDITRTLQHNITRERLALQQGRPRMLDTDLNSMFAAVSIYGRTAYVAVIARRSRHFAGARFLKRGANDLGYVANDVETEQIVSEVNTTSFHSPGPRLYASPQYTSYVQHRGSIPLHWSQDSTGVTPKPPIELNLIDPFYTSAALHFDNLFGRYGAPIYALNLVKSRERTPRESKLLEEYTKAISYLNQFLPEGKRIIHKAWDMSRAAKSRDQDVIGILEGIAEDVVTTTGFFHNGDGVTTPARVQNGVARTNCIDCLDRTNAAQFVIGKRALGHQLHALGILEDTVVNYDTDAVNLLTHMYHDHGDTIAVQYGGSQLVNTMETYRKINQWTSHSRDMIESFKRYYNNSFLDGQRQEAYNLFLGNYIFAQGQPMLWDLATDYYLHHADPRGWLGKPRHDYINWFTPEFLKPREVPPSVAPPARGDNTASKPVSYFDDYWLEYYRPSTLSSFLKMFPYKMNSTIKFIPFKSTQEGRYDLSPFRVRTEGDQDVQDKRRRAKKEVTILAPHDVPHAGGGGGDAASIAGSHRSGASTAAITSSTPKGYRGWLENTQDPKYLSFPQPNGGIHGIMKDGTSPATAVLDLDGNAKNGKPSTLEKTRAAQWTFAKMVQESLNPSVSGDETEDYARYISHPQTLPLVVTADPEPSDDVDGEYQEYVSGSWQTVGLTPRTTSNGGGGGGGGAAVNGSSHHPLLHHHHQYRTHSPSLSQDDRGGGSVLGRDAYEDGDDTRVYEELLRVGENPLTVTEEDTQKKRYKAYGKWLRGKSLFKQQPVD